MKYKTIYKDYSLFGILNIALFQWIGLRLEIEVSKNMDLTCINLIYPIVPRSGWTNPYRFFWGTKALRKRIWTFKK